MYVNIHVHMYIHIYIYISFFFSSLYAYTYINGFIYLYTCVYSMWHLVFNNVDLYRTVVKYNLICFLFSLGFILKTNFCESSMPLEFLTLDGRKSRRTCARLNRRMFAVQPVRNYFFLFWKLFENSEMSRTVVDTIRNARDWEKGKMTLLTHYRYRFL